MKYFSSQKKKRTFMIGEVKLFIDLPISINKVWMLFS